MIGIFPLVLNTIESPFIKNMRTSQLKPSKAYTSDYLEHIMTYRWVSSLWISMSPIRTIHRNRYSGLSTSLSPLCLNMSRLCKHVMVTRDIRSPHEAVFDTLSGTVEAAPVLGTLVLSNTTETTFYPRTRSNSLALF